MTVTTPETDQGLSEHDWELLLKRIKNEKCTPFLGAGAAVDTLPLGGAIAEEWAKAHGYPLDDAHDLARVAQYRGIERGDPMLPKEEIKERLEREGEPDVDDEDDPHRVLAQLPFPLYITTNYDDFMFKALRAAGKDPLREVCRWTQELKATPSALATRRAFRPSVANPVVFHLHGHLGHVESLVLTEDDYLDFLVNVSKDRKLIPHQIQEALGGTTLIFLGYRLADWDFRVLHRGLVTRGTPAMRRLSVTVQVPAPPDSPKGEAARKYLDQYFGQIAVRVYWGTARDFTQKLRERWKAFEG